MNYQNFCYLGDQFEFGYGKVLIVCRHFSKPDSHNLIKINSLLMYILINLNLKTYKKSCYKFSKNTE
jgi:hypothetical protein